MAETMVMKRMKYDEVSWTIMSTGKPRLKNVIKVIKHDAKMNNDSA